MIDQTLEDMIWRVVSRYAELSGAEAAMTPSAAYGAARRAVPAGAARLPHRRPADALDDLVGQVHALMPLLLRDRAAEP